jgi:hypothetical protein
MQKKCDWRVDGYAAIALHAPTTASKKLIEKES